MTDLTLEGLISILNSVHTQIKHQLAKISELDQEVDAKMRRHKILTQTLIASMEDSQVKQQAKEMLITKMLEEISNLQKQIQISTEEKIRLSNSIYCSISEKCEYFNQVVGEERLNSQLRIDDAKFKKSYLLTEEVETIFREEQKAELQTYCFCEGKTNGGTMIQCQAKDCSKRWYHLSCLKIQNSKIPKGQWLCPECKDRAKRASD